jgi:ABC-type Fe3+ transport system permease subunit
VARYAWLAGLVAWISHRSLPAVVTDQARTDGASEWRIAWWLRHGPNAVLLLGGVGVVAALSMADVALGSLLSVPGIGPISGRVIEKMHRFEDEMLVGLCLWIVVGALPGLVLAWGAAWAARRRTG